MLARRTIRALSGLGAFKASGPFETRLFINNEFVKAKSGKQFATVNPATEETIAHVEEAGAADVDLAVQAANAAFPAWQATAYSKKRDLLYKLADLIDQNRDYLASLESLDNGKPLNNAGYSSRGDLELTVQCFRYFAGWADKIHGKVLPVDPPQFALTRHEPIGVVGQIIPWNFPLLMLAWKFAPALATGNTLVLKTSEKTPLSALAVCKLVKEAGFPAGVVNVLSGYGAPAGDAIVRHPLVGKVAFTGSTAVGKRIMATCAETVKRVSLELGGKSPLIVMDDADLDQALLYAHVGLFLNQGQCCCASSRLFVHEAIYDAFVAKATAQAKGRVVGDPTDAKSDQGPQVDKLQFDKVMSYIDAGKKAGAKLVTGGARAGTKGYFIQPTVFADVTDDMVIAKEEIFGPVMSILKFKTLDEAITRANATEYGLAAGIMTKNITTALKAATALRAGTVWVNCYDAFSAVAPFGGFKESGIGRDNGEYALENYTDVKCININMA